MRDPVADRSLSAAVASVLAAALLSANAAAAPSILKGGDFEGVEGRSFWHANGGEVVSAARPGAAGGGVFRVTTDKPVWRMGRQKVDVPGGAKAVRLSGWARTKGIAPPPDVEWRRAQMQIGYHDAGGALIGKWHDVDLPLGDSPWTFYKSDFPVPAGTRTVIVFLGNNNVSGTSWFDDVRVEALDADGRGLGDAVGAAKLASVETVPGGMPPQPAEGGEAGVGGEDAAPQAAPDAAPEPEPEPESDDPDADEEAGGLSALVQAAIGGGVVLAMMVVFALVARGRGAAPSDA